MTVKVAPNPATGGFYLSIDSKCTNAADIEILDASGKKVWSDKQDLTVGQLKIYLSAERWTSGLYAVQVRCGGKLVTTKVLIGE
jgi:Secretion system C-terminal sorting domain